MFDTKRVGVRIAVWLAAITWVASIPILAWLAFGDSLGEWADPEYEAPMSHQVAWALWLGVGAVLLAILLSKIGRWLVRTVRGAAEEVRARSDDA